MLREGWTETASARRPSTRRPSGKWSVHMSNLKQPDKIYQESGNPEDYSDPKRRVARAHPLKSRASYLRTRLPQNAHERGLRYWLVAAAVGAAMLLVFALGGGCASARIRPAIAACPGIPVLLQIRVGEDGRVENTEDLIQNHITLWEHIYLLRKAASCPTKSNRN